MSFCQPLYQVMETKALEPDQILALTYRKGQHTMQTSKSTKNINSDLKEAFALWEKKKGDKVYFTGKTSGDDPINLVAFVNTNKKTEKQPDINVYESGEAGDKKPELATLWKNTSKAGKVYYSGYTNDKEKIIAFVNGNTAEGKYPAIRVYYKQDEK